MHMCISTRTSTLARLSAYARAPATYLPVGAAQFKGVEMDVLYASLGQFLIPENLDLSHNSVLRGCDEQSVRSLNGCRVTDTILRCVGV